MGSQPRWPAAEPIATARLLLEPLRVEHADEMFALLDDRRLHDFIGGQPLSLEQLRNRYARLAVGQSMDGLEGYFNWIVRDRETRVAVGTVQATLKYSPPELSAEVAWITATADQGQGYATEAATGMVAWLRRRGTNVLVAYIHPSHEASKGVARHLGLKPTDITRDGETRWESDPS